MLNEIFLLLSISLRTKHVCLFDKCLWNLQFIELYSHPYNFEECVITLVWYILFSRLIFKYKYVFVIVFTRSLKFRCLNIINAQFSLRFQSTCLHRLNVYYYVSAYVYDYRLYHCQLPIRYIKYTYCTYFSFQLLK